MNSRSSTPGILTRFFTPGIMAMMALAMFLGSTHTAYAQDLDPVSSNYQLIPAGSYVIAMDSAHQQDAGNNNYFNIKAYGLLASLLDNRIALYWAIRAGKAKDDTDFSAMAKQVFPTTTAPSVLDFRAGPFIAQPSDTTGFDSVVIAFNAANPTHKVNVYQLTQATWVDIRYSYFSRPRTAVLNDGGYASIMLNYMTAASMPSENYEELTTGANLTDPDTCFTFASEPHNTSPVAAVIDSIRSFVNRGGNFLAQCAAVYNYENSSSPGFQTTTGITGVLVLFGTNLGPTFYRHPDLSFTQYQGTFDPAAIPVASYCAYYYLNTGSAFINHADKYDQYLGSDSSDIGQSVSKLDTGLGHMVFYDAGHDYSATNDPNNINGMRSYFDAMFTPSAYHPQCAFLVFNNDLSITKTAKPASLIVGHIDTFTMIVTNNGPYSVNPHNVSVVDSLPPGFTYVSSTASTGSYSSSTHVWSIDSLPVYEFDTLVITATAVSAGTITNTAFINRVPFDFNQTDDTARATVIVHACMTLNAGNDTVICLGNSVVLGGSPTDTGGTAPYTYIWHPAGSLSADSVPNPIATPDSTTRYTLTVTDANSCRDTGSVTVTIHPLPTITLTPAQICIGNSDTLIAGGGISYIWSTTATTDTIIVSPHSSTPYSVTVTDADHCTASASATVIVNSLPTPTISPSSSHICGGYKDTLTAGGGVSYAWSNGANTDTTIVSPLSDSTYTVTVTTAHSCTASTTATVTVNPAPTAIITATSAQICLGGKDTLTTGGGISYAWSNAATTASTIVSPATTTLYSVTVTGANTCSASDTVSVIVDTLPTPVITLTPAQICLGDKDTLSVGGGISYAWSNAANTDTIIVSPGSSTPYSVTVTDVNHCTASTTNTVIVNALPTPTISLTSLQICGGYKDTLIARGGVSYAWSNGANTDTTIVSPLTDSTYTVTVTNANTCSAAATATVTVNPSPTPSITPTSAQICIGNSDTLTAGGGGSYAWSNAATTAITIVSPLVDSTYTVTVTGANTCSASDSITVIVNPLPTPVITLTSALICSGNKDTLIAGGGISYAWSSASNTDTTIVSPATTTIYTVTVTDAQSCSDTASQTVIVNPLPPVTISPAAAQICLGSGTTLTATGGGSYVWSNGSNTDTTTVAPATTTAYSVTVTANSCTASATDVVTVIPVPTLSVGPDTVICAQISYNIPGVTTATSIIWSPDSGLSNANIVAPIFHYNDSVNFTYTVIAYDTPSGCADTVYLNIGMSNCVSYIEGPEAFSPNNDGINDFYTLFSSQIAKYDIRIYNRWGEMVYESTDLSALNDISKGWDGTYHGKPQPLGVFVYYINATDTFNKQISHKGNITLIR